VPDETVAGGDAAPDEEDLAVFGQAVDVAVHVPTLSGALVAGLVAGAVWTWRQLRRGRAAGSVAV
jgi:hypothetical protein